MQWGGAWHEQQEEAGVPWAGDQLCDLKRQPEERRKGNQLDHSVWEKDVDNLTQGEYVSLRVR